MSGLSDAVQETNITNTEDKSKPPNELSPKIIDFTERLQVFSWGLQNYFIDVYLTSNSSRSLEKMNYKNRKYRAETDLDELQEEIQLCRNKYGEKNQEFNDACQKLDAVLKSFDETCIMIDGTYILPKAAKDLKSLKYVDAIVNLRELHDRVDKLEYQGTLATALRSFRAISDTQLAVSQGQLSVEFSNLFRWNYNRGVNTLTYSLVVQQSDPDLLDRVLKALYIADQMVIDIQPFSHFFVIVLVANIIKYNCEIYTEDEVGALVFNIKIDLSDPNRPSLPTIFNNLTAIFEFLETTMTTKMEVTKTFFECFGDCNRDEFFTKIIQDCIKNNLPYSEDSHQIYKDIAVELESFNKFLVNLKYVKADKSPLQKFIDHTDLLMYDSKCKRMLIEVRDLMKEYLSLGIITVGTSSDEKPMLDMRSQTFKYDFNTPLFFPKCVISQNMKDIVTLVTTYLEEIAVLPSIYANQLLPYIKDVPLMYQALVVHRNADRLKTHNLEIALFFNNCHYLAHSLVGPPWKNVFPADFADQLNTMLMTNIHDLRTVGIEKFSVYVRRTRDAIVKKVSGTCKFFNVSTVQEWSMEAFEEFNENVNHVLALLRETRDTWYNVLPDRIYKRAMCALVEAISESMVKRSLRQFDDITEDIICLLASRVQYAIDEIVEIHSVADEPVVPCIDTERNYFERSRYWFSNRDALILDSKVKFWEKFLMIPKLFTAQLTEITGMWNETDILKGIFSCDEIRMILRVRFPNNHYLMKVLRSVQ